MLYTDDANLFLESTNLNEMLPLINEDLKAFSDWCTINRLTINISKTNYIILKNPQNKF